MIGNCDKDAQRIDVIVIEEMFVHIEDRRESILGKLSEYVMYKKFARILVLYNADDMRKIFQALREAYVKVQRNEAMWDRQGITIIFSLALS